MGTARASDGRPSRSRGGPPDPGGEPEAPSDRDVDPSDPARSEGLKWKLYAVDGRPALADPLAPLRAVGKYRRSGKVVFDVDTRSQRDVAKRALHDAGGPELAASVIIRIRPERAFESRRRSTRADVEARKTLERIQRETDQETA